MCSTTQHARSTGLNSVYNKSEAKPKAVADRAANNNSKAHGGMLRKMYINHLWQHVCMQSKWGFAVMHGVKVGPYAWRPVCMGIKPCTIVVPRTPYAVEMTASRRPYMSDNLPITTPPRGRVKNGTAKQALEK